MVVQIATLWNANNYGAYFQAFALGKCIQNEFDIEEVYYLEECIEKNKISSCIAKTLKKTIYQFKLRRSFIKSRKCFRTIKKEEKSDVTIIGADEVWNVNNTFFDNIDAYIGKGMNTRVSFAYAPSCNGASAEDFKSVYGNEPFKNLSCIAVRDKSTQQMVFDITGCEPKIVLDPTFLLDDYSDMIQEVEYKNYLFVYGYSFSDLEINKIQEYAKKHNLKTISAGVYQGWTDMQIPASPKQFLGLIKQADFVVTSTFHGTVFSIIFNKNFVSYARNNKKVMEMLSLFDLDERNGTVNKKLTNIFEQSINYDIVNRKIDIQRNISLEYLKGGIIDGD